MIEAIWYALVFLISSVSSPEYAISNADILQNSVPVLRVEIRGDFRSGAFYSGDQLIGDYESSRRYRQTYILHPRLDLEELLSGEADPVEIEDAPAEPDLPDGTEAEENLESRTLFGAGSPVPPVAFDLTPVLAGRPNSGSGEVVSIPDTGYEELFGASGWTYRRDGNRYSLFNAELALAILLEVDEYRD